ncbi:phosphoenolpyruvate-protein phosphotransferase [Pseudomonas aeruginosa]|nr:phosphoenolpyruvate-protein phosphotransferase [Pseudomonas aeruginosa]
MLIDQGVGAAHAWHRAIQAQCEILQALGNLLLAERANDLRDLEKRVLRVLLGDTAPLRVPAGAIVAAREITPPTSRRWWMPARLACAWPKAAPPPTWPSSPAARACRAWWRSAPGCWELEEGRQVVLDAGQGRLELSPDARRLEQVALQVAQREEQRRRQQADAQREALTATAGASRSAPTSPRRARPPKPSPTAPTGSACYAPSFSSSSAAPRPTKRSSATPTRRSWTPWASAR